MRISHRPSAGFTLVEMAIVLVIIGLIIAGVLTAQQITQNAKITSTIQSIKSYQAATQSYSQNYGILPGVDKQGGTRFGQAGRDGSGGNTILGTFDSTAAADSNEDSRLFWLHLRGAKLIKGDASSNAQPSNAFNGIFGVQGEKATFGTGGFVATTNVLCLNKIPGGAANAIDQQLDDGEPDTGTIKATSAGTATDKDSVATSYINDTLYVMCTPL